VDHPVHWARFGDEPFLLCVIGISAGPVTVRPNRRLT